MVAPLEEQDVSVHHAALDSQLPDKTLDRGFLWHDSELEDSGDLPYAVTMPLVDQTPLRQRDPIDISGRGDKLSP